MAFTYFFRDLQTEVIRRFDESLAPVVYFATEQTLKKSAEIAGLFE